MVNDLEDLKFFNLKNFEEVYITWKNGSISSKHAQELLGLRNNTFYRIINEHERKK